MKKLILMSALLFSIYGCTQMKTDNTESTEKQNQLLSFCNEYTTDESGLVSAPCQNLETKNRLEEQKEIQMQAYCMNFVADEKLATSDSSNESTEYKECKTIAFEKLSNETKE